jgi:hypothetical protein
MTSNAMRSAASRLPTWHPPAKNFPYVQCLQRATCGRSLPWCACRGEAVQRRARLEWAEACLRAGRRGRPAPAPLAGSSAHPPQTNPRARGNPANPSRARISNEPSCVGTRSNPGRSKVAQTRQRTQSRTNPSCSNGLQIALSGIQTNPSRASNSNEPEAASQPDRTQVRTRFLVRAGRISAAWSGPHDAGDRCRSLP